MRNCRLLVAVLVLASSSTMFAYEENVEVFIKAALVSVPAAEAPCGGAPEGAGPMVGLVCAQATADFEKFQEAWDQRVSGDATLPKPPKPLTEWLTGINGWIRWYSIGETWLVVSFDKADRKVAISYPKHREGVFAIGQGIIPPKRISKEIPRGETAGEVRAGLKPGGQGIVVLSAVVRRDGAIGDVEVLGCVPRHRGLEQAAIRLIKKWRYEPARINGEPADVAMNATISFGAEGSYRSSENTNYTAADGGGAGIRGSSLN